MTTEEVKMWLSSGVSIEDINLILAHEEIGSNFPAALKYAKTHEKLQYCKDSLDWLIPKMEYVQLHKEFDEDTQAQLQKLLADGDIQQFHSLMQQLDNQGLWKVDVDIAFVLEAVKHDFQRTLLGYLKDKQYNKFEAAINWLNFIWVWDNSIDTAIQQGNIEAPFVYETDKFDEDGNRVTIKTESSKERRELIIDDVLEMAENGDSISITKQYTGTALLIPKFFYNQDKKLLKDLEDRDIYPASIHVNNQPDWPVAYCTEKYANMYETLEPFDCAVLDVFFTLYCYDIRLVTVNQVDKLLSGNTGRHSSEQKKARILDSITRLSAIHIGFTVRGKTYEPERLLDVDCFHHLTDETGTYSDTFIYLHGINNIYQYAKDMHEIANVPKEYYDTSKLPKKYQFEDTETAIILKRRIITRVMGIISKSKRKKDNTGTWNRIALIQKGTNKEGVFPELGLMPDTNGKSKAEAKEIADKWRRKEKPLYIKIVKGTLENLKANYAILDYEDYRETPKDPIKGFDIICFNKTELNALAGLREELKADYVKSLLEKRKAALTK